MLVERYNVTSKQLDDICSQLNKIKRLLSQEGGSSIPPEDIDLALQDIIEGKFNRNQKDYAILKLLSKGESIVIPACDGIETLANAKEIFKSGINGDFKNWGTEKSGIATKEQSVDVHELERDSTFAQMFGSLRTNLDKLCLTQSQIKNFCKKYPEWLCQNGHDTFFLFKDKDQFFVAGVGVRSDGLRVLVDRFEVDYIWVAGSLRRIVVPQLTT